MEDKSKRSRKLREWYPNAMYHITSRGNRRNDIFRDNEDYQVYVTILKEAKASSVILPSQCYLLSGDLCRRRKYFDILSDYNQNFKEESIESEC